MHCGLDLKTGMELAEREAILAPSQISVCHHHLPTVLVLGTPQHSNIPTPILTLRYTISRRLPNVRVLYDNQYELLVGCDHDLSVATSHPQHAQFVRRVQIPHEVRRPRRELRQHRRVFRRLLLRQGRLERCSCEEEIKENKGGGEWFMVMARQGHRPKSQ